MKKSTADLKIDGHGSSGGGSYNSVIINGHGKIDGDLECIYMKINGHCSVNGNVKADSVKVHGSTSINGNLEVEKAKIHGTADIDGNVSVEKAETYGSIDVNGDCNAEIFKIEGTFEIKGLLNAGELDLSLYGPSKAHEIGGEKITVKKKGKYDFWGLKSLTFGRNKGLMADIVEASENALHRISFYNKELTTETIEGDDIYLENTQAKVVRGNNVELGPGCEIELVEYKDSFKQDEEAEVGTHRQI